MKLPGQKWHFQYYKNTNLHWWADRTHFTISRKERVINFKSMIIFCIFQRYCNKSSTVTFFLILSVPIIFRHLIIQCYFCLIESVFRTARSSILYSYFLHYIFSLSFFTGHKDVSVFTDRSKSIHSHHIHEGRYLDLNNLMNYFTLKSLTH